MSNPCCCRNVCLAVKRSKSCHVPVFQSHFLRDFRLGRSLRPQRKLMLHSYLLYVRSRYMYRQVPLYFEVHNASNSIQNAQIFSKYMFGFLCSLNITLTIVVPNMYICILKNDSTYFGNKIGAVSDPLHLLVICFLFF